MARLLRTRPHRRRDLGAVYSRHPSRPGSHEDRTLTQLRVDVAAALLLNQSLAVNQIYAPAPARTAPDAPTPPDSGPAPGRSPGSSPDPEARDNRSATSTGTDRLQNGCAAASEASPEMTAVEDAERRDSPADDSLDGLGVERSTGPGEMASLSGFPEIPNFCPVEPDPCRCGETIDTGQGNYLLHSWSIPVFDDPDYDDPSFSEPEDPTLSNWTARANPPVLLTAPPKCASGSAVSGAATPACDLAGNGAPWPPLPRVLPILMIPALSLLGATNEPAWMQGVDPISMEVAKRLTSQATSFYRVLVDPISNELLDKALETY